LSKTLPCKWDQQKIIVMDDVMIVSPYTGKDVKVIPGKTDSQVSLLRVQKVLELERQRLGI
jgi:hypothetical protein